MTSIEELQWKFEQIQGFKGVSKGVYLDEDLWDLVDTLIKFRDDKYSSRNHFFRCAVNKLVREELGGGQ